MKVAFHRSYNHRWPSRAVTHFPAGWSGRVKREVGAAAISKGCATEVPSRGSNGTDAPAQTPDMAATGRMAGYDGGADRGTGVLMLGDALAGERQ